MINRIVLIGNGFDLAHGLKTSYKDFINWYWDDRFRILERCDSNVSKDILCSLILCNNFHENSWSEFAHKNPEYFTNNNKGCDILKKMLDDHDVNFSISNLFANICDSVEYLNWVDIENEYYSMLCDIVKGKSIYNIDNLNIELNFLKEKLCEYLSRLKSDYYNKNVKNHIVSPLIKDDISTKSNDLWEKFLIGRESWTFMDWKTYCGKYNIDICMIQSRLDYEYNDYNNTHPYTTYDEVVHNEFLQKPDNILILNFNYTHVADSYLDNELFKTIHIHGDLLDSKKMIFGYGDELDEDFKRIENLNDNRYLKNIKSTCYMQSSNYRRLMEFMNTAPYQVIIMGHSCGNSDRTLLNALFEHENCISIKPYYYEDKDGNEHYTDMVQNIYRNFTNKADFRDKVVNIEYCEKMPQVEDN